MVLRTLRRPAHSTVVAYVALVLAMSGTAVAATGGNFLLGKANSAGRTTTLTNTGSGAALRLSAHNLTTPPLSVGHNKTKVGNLNADFLDGLTSARLQRRVTGTCANGSAIRTVKVGGAVACSHPVMWAVVNSDGSLARSSGSVTSSSPNTGQYVVTFPVDVSGCSFVAADGLTGSVGVAPPVIVGASGELGDAKGVFIGTYTESGTSFSAANAAFHLLVVC